jgi:hypothetical protein
MSERNPEHYLSRAKELRTEAARRSDEIARNILINAAEQCEQMARNLELRGPLKLPDGLKPGHASH